MAFPQEDVRRIATEFARYDTSDLVASLGALQLMPANACGLGRLEVAATIGAANTPVGGRPAISRGRLRTLLNSPPFTSTLSADDPPYDELLVEPLAFHGGMYLVSPGLGRESVYILEHLARSLFLHHRPFPNPAFLEQTRAACMAGLRVSDLVLKHAGFDRYALPEGAVGDPITAGNPTEFELLKRAVRFSTAELERLLRPLTLDDLAPLVQDLGDPEANFDSTRGGALHARPIVKAGDEYSVALPLGLVDAVRHAILSTAAQLGCQAAVAGRFREAVAGDVDSSLKRMGAREETVTLPPPPSELPVIESVYRVDDDKLLYVQVISEDLTSYHAEHVFGEWENSGLDFRLDGRRRRVERELTKVSPTGTSVMYLAVPQLMGRQWTMRFDAATTRPDVGPELGLSGADLRVVAELEDSNAVALFKYAENRGLAAPPDHPLVMLDSLGTYTLYREHGFSLRMDYSGADAGKPLRYFGAGLRLRAEAKRRRDPHAAHFDGNHGVTIERMDAEGKDPIYVAVPPPHLSIPLLVDGLPAPVWVFGPEPQSREEAEGNHHIMYMVAFWLWQLTDGIGPVVEAAARLRTPLHVRLDLGQGRAWLSGPPTGSTDLGSQSLSADNGVVVRFGAGNFDELRTEGNCGERTVMKHVVEGLRALAARAGGDELLDDDALNTLLDREFANPRRKHLLLLSIDNLQAATGPLPGHRPVQHADRSEVKYELGEHLRRTLGLDYGPVPPKRRTEVLGTARDWCLAEVERRVGELSPVGLLERVIALNESVVRSRFMLELKVPTRLACYESEVETRERLLQELPEANLAGVVYRFLVEYVAAVPPAGTTPVSTTVTDRLAAIVAEMQEVATGLDALTVGLSDAELTLNEHGELAFGTPGAYLEAQSDFLDVHVGESIARTDAGFGRHWKQREPAPTLMEPEVADLDAAMVFETGGLSVVDVRKLVEALANIGFDINDEPKRMARAELERSIADKLSWSVEKARTGIDFFVLRSRGSFYSDAKPPAWAKSDVQPWRFNRRLSFLRRPLVERQAPEGPEVLWGIRHLWGAWPLQITYLQMSRFKASSKELVTMLGGIANARGKEFEVKVAELYERHDRFEVLRGRDTFNRKFMARASNNAEPLGDVDVLVAEPARESLVAVEAKDIAMALTPSELADELAEYFETADGAKRAAAMDRHQERMAWLRDHIADVLSEFPFDAGDAAEWSVDGLIVTDDAVPSPHIIRPALPVVSYRELETRLANPRPVRKAPKKKKSARRS